MGHMLRNISAPRRMRPFVAICASGAHVYATAQTARRWSRTLFPSRWIMAVGTIAISPDALYTNVYTLRMKATLGHLSMVRPTDCRCASTREFRCVR